MVAPAFLRLPDVIQRTGLPRSTVYYLTKHGSFPPAVRLGARSVAWRVEDVDTWIASRPSAH